MKYLNIVDYGVILGYLVILLAIGLYLKKRASQSLEHYFLAGRKMPWWALGISSMSAWLDMAGTMVIVSFLYLLGPRPLHRNTRRGVPGACVPDVVDGQVAQAFRCDDGRRVDKIQIRRGLLGQFRTAGLRICDGDFLAWFIDIRV